MFCRRSVVLLLGFLLFTMPSAHADFSFVHITDIHVTAADGEESNAAKDAALFREISVLDPKPAFVVNTGDVCEVGTDAEYAIYRKTLDELKMPSYAAPGNHDVRWNPRGKEGYTRNTNQPLYRSWDYENIHFVLLDSTVLLQHWGHFDQAQLNWLAEDLKKTGPEKPVIIGFHHWIGRESVQVDNEEELLRIIAPYNIRLFLIGHGHSDIQWNINGIPAVMSKGLYQGSYNLVKVTAQELTVYRRTMESGKPSVEVLTSPLARQTRPRGSVTLSARAGIISSGIGVVAVERGEFPPNSKAAFRIDSGTETPLAMTLDGWRGTIDLTRYMPGFHLLTLAIETPEGNTYRVPVDFGVEARENARPVWRVNVGGEVQGKLVAANGLVYVPSMGGDLVALDGKKGEVKWRIKTGGSVFSAPLVADETVYFGSADHYVYAADAKSGKVKWKTKTEGAVFAGAAKAGNIICIASTDTKIYGLSADKGTVVWTAQGENMYQSQAATDGERFFVGGWDNYFRCLEVKTGKELWKQPFGKHEKSGKYLFYFAPAIGSPTVGNGKVFVSSNDGQLHAMDAKTGKIVWEIPGPSLGYSGPLFHDGRIYNASLTDQGRVFCFDAADGKPIWESVTGSVIYDSSCALSNGRVYVGCVSGVFSCLSAIDGKIRWQFRLPPGHLLASPAVDPERVYIGSLSGDVIAFPGK